MNSVFTDQRSLGVTFREGKAEVLLWSPPSETVEIRLLKNDKRLPLTKTEYGYWSLTTDELQPGDFYKFLLNGETERPDPTSLAQPEGVHGASQAIDLQDFRWTDQSWNNLPLDQYVMYELHTGTFTPEGTFAAIEGKLDYLKELGVNAIEIMPVAQFPGSRNWGYDGVYPNAVQHSYGGARGLQHLVNACHEKGIAVVLDVVYNHMGPEGNYFSDFAPYFTTKYITPWGRAINFEDAWCDGVRRYFIENALMWFRDFHIDALRLDAVHAIKDFSPTHILREIKQHVDQLMAETGRQHYLIVELDLNDTRFINPLEEQGYGMDAQWIDEFHHALRVTATGDQSGYYSDFTGISHLAKAYRDAYVYDGQYSPHRNKRFGIKAEKNPGQQFVVFTQNHDQVGNRMMGERLGQLVSFEMQKLVAGAVLVSPYLPMLFMGEEYSELNPFLYFVSHTDPDLAEAVRKGRKAEFAYFHLEGEAPDPTQEETFQQSKLQWQLVEQGPHQKLFNYYRTLIALRKLHPALRHLNRRYVEAEADESRQTLILHRWYNEQHILALMNFAKEQQAVSLDRHSGQWKKILDSADSQWGNGFLAPEFVSSPSTLTLQPESFLLYTSHV
ncbi:malto-oligosyltrehalose trehalohydrolase [Nibrella saemangeumensis]|uniref:Malto-oligosyltrehalose trehalohydrolase n=1 Tax=Nibrella saemangeumensis TaxID=1084526 RepID=A0ABP8MCC1_9BACT